MAKAKKTQNLVTPAQYGRLVAQHLGVESVLRSTISERIKAGTIQTTEVGGVKFIDLNQYPVEGFGDVTRGRPKKVDKSAK